MKAQKWIALGLAFSCSIGSANLRERLRERRESRNAVPKGHLLPLPHLTRPESPIIHNGKPLEDKDYPQVVGIVTKSESYNEKTRTFETTSNLCTASIFNSSCLVTAKHCLKSDSQIITGIEVHATKNVAGSPSTTVDKSKILSREGQDLAVVRIDKPFPKDRSFHLSDIADATKGEEGTVVGYGATEAKKKEGADGAADLEVGNAGVKHEGKVQIGAVTSQSIFANSRAKDWDRPNRSLPGDSGGPLGKLGADGMLQILGVAKGVFLDSGANEYTSLSANKPWLEAALSKLCPVNSGKVIADLTVESGGSLGTESKGYSFEMFSKWADSNPAKLVELKTAIKALARIEGNIRLSPSTPFGRGTANEAQKYFHYQVSDTAGKTLGYFAVYKDGEKLKYVYVDTSKNNTVSSGDATVR